MKETTIEKKGNLLRAAAIVSVVGSVGFIGGALYCALNPTHAAKHAVLRLGSVIGGGALSVGGTVVTRRIVKKVSDDFFADFANSGGVE